MSGRNKGRQALIEERFTIDITGVSKKALKKYMERPKKHLGSGKRRLQLSLPNINPNAIIRLPIEDDNLCLFRSIDILRAKFTKKRQTFHDYLKNVDRQNRDINAMLNACRIPSNKSKYAIEDNGLTTFI